MIYYLYIFSLILLPIFGTIISRYFYPTKHIRVILWSFFLLVIYNVFFLFGYSFKGDNVDYLIFALEYPFVLLTMIDLAKIRKNIFTETLRTIGFITMVAVIIVSAANLILFVTIDMEYVSDKQFNYISNNKNYETRRYSFSFATLINTRYTFDTYRTYKYFPIEKRIDNSIFFDNKTDLNIAGDLLFKINEEHNKTSLIISSQGVKFVKELK